MFPPSESTTWQRTRGNVKGFALLSKISCNIIISDSEIGMAKTLLLSVRRIVGTRPEGRDVLTAFKK